MENSIKNVELYIDNVPYKEDDSLKFQAVESPEWPIGATKVRITLLDNRNRKVEQFQEEINDDGAIARQSNIKVKWYGDYIEVILKGSEQEDSIHTIKY